MINGSFIKVIGFLSGGPFTSVVTPNCGDCFHCRRLEGNRGRRRRVRTPRTRDLIRPYTDTWVHWPRGIMATKTKWNGPRRRAGWGCCPGSPARVHLARRCVAPSCRGTFVHCVSHLESPSLVCHLSVTGAPLRSNLEVIAICTVCKSIPGTGCWPERSLRARRPLRTWIMRFTVWAILHSPNFCLFWPVVWRGPIARTRVDLFRKSFHFLRENLIANVLIVLLRHRLVDVLMMKVIVTVGKNWTSNFQLLHHKLKFAAF